MKKEGYVIILGVILLIGLNYNFLDNALQGFLVQGELAQVQRIVDGDTLKINNDSVRLLGINCPEKGEKYYSEAKEFLENETLNQIVRLESKGKDLYYRELAYVFIGSQNINLKLVEEGYANYYFPEGKDSYYDKFVKAWIECMNQNKNLCEKSEDKCSKCIVLENFGEGQNVVLKNVCDFECDLKGWTIKDEGRKKFTFEEKTLYQNEKVTLTPEDFGKTYVWTSSGDTLFLRDSEGKLVLWEPYLLLP